jgi:hypothetical protein
MLALEGDYLVTNVLYSGDDVDILRRHLPNAAVVDWGA